VNVVVHHAGIQDRDGAALVLDRTTRSLFPVIEVIFADGGYQGPIAAAKIRETGDWRLSIVKRSDQAKGFVVLPKRWLVERTLSWLTRCRRLVRHYEQYFTTSVAFIRLAMIRLMLRRLDRK
jgi:transposase